MVNGEWLMVWWNKFVGYWELPNREAVSLGLDSRIIIDKIEANA